MCDGWVTCSTQLNLLELHTFSCSPNAVMREVFANRQWNIVVTALRNIEVNEEICHDFDLVTEDPELRDTPCRCGSSECRVNFYKYVKW